MSAAPGVEKSMIARSPSHESQLHVVLSSNNYSRQQDENDKEEFRLYCL